LSVAKTQSGRSWHVFGHASTTLSASILVAVVLSSSLCWCQLQSKPGVIAKEQPVFRPPFALKLRLDGQRNYEEKFERIPYVAANEVYLFAGETFGVNLTITDDQVSGIAYQQDAAKANVELRFTQEQAKNGLMMLLVVRNGLKRKLFFDALMTIPGKEGFFKTTVLPVEPNLSNFESWPHPIVQLVLRNFRFSEKGQNP
jgi:hypothetical protein